MNDNLERLLWQRKDGELAAEDRAQLESLLAEGASVEEREIESIARLLSRARFEEEEVPAELRSRVLAQVQARTASRRSSHGVVESNRNALATGLSTLVDAFKKESLMSRKRMALLGAAGVVVVAGVTFLVLSEDFPPTGRVTGAIGGVEKAERYRDAQVTASDVAVPGVGTETAGKDDLAVSSDKTVLANDKNALANDKGVDLSANDKGVAINANDKGAKIKANDKGADVSANDKGVAINANDKGAIAANDKGVIHSANDKGVIHSANDKGVIHSANDKGALGSANDKGVAINANDKGVAINANDKGVAINANDKGAKIKANDKGADVSANDKGALGSANDKGVKINANDKGALD